MEQKAGIQISKRAFFQSLVILLILMLAAGILTHLVPAGQYERVILDERQIIDPASFHSTASPNYPIWRWFTAPLEVLWGPDSLTIIVIIIFLLMIGGSFAVMDRCGIVYAALGKIVTTFGSRKYPLLLVIAFFFMSLGALFGLFEEIVPLVPVMVALSYSLGWDALVGLGMSILATNMGFSAALTNPFTIGVAQKLAGLPLFSGTWLRLIVFLVVYIVFAFFLVGYAKKIERVPSVSPIFKEDQPEREKYQAKAVTAFQVQNRNFGKSIAWFLSFLVLILIVLFAGAVFPAISDISLPLVGILFLAGGVGAGLISSSGRIVWKALGEGISGIAPGIILILMAMSIKHIVVQGGIMDSVLHSAAQPFSNASPLVAAIAIFGLALLIEFFISSGSAKAFLMMPILLPLSDLIGINRQITVTAYCFGDGFSNLAYPTNPVLLICLGLTVVSYARWLRWTLKLWLWILPVILVFLALAVAINYGPF